MNDIIIDNIGKSFANKEVLVNVTLSLSKGKIYGLIGRNGAGKSTLMKILCGLYNADKGNITKPNNTIGALIEEPSAYLNMNAKDNLRIFMNCFSKADDEKIEKILYKTGLEGNKKKIKEYSLGMKKRLGLAIALLNEPDFLILDEPTSGLDIEGISVIRKIIREYMNDKEKTILISSHDTRDIVLLCDEIIFINEGRIMLKLRDFERDSIKLEELYLEAVKDGTML